MSAYDQFTTDRFIRDLYDRWATTPPESRDEEEDDDEGDEDGEE